jgi:protein-L-isoaspartate(D-aspartate) O-methyltransferase
VDTPPVDPEWTRRRAMVAEQVEKRGVRDEAVLSALRTVPRHLFVPADLREQAYEDRPLPIGHGQTISQPYVVAAMSEALQVGAGDRVLEVGTGCGYQAAVLAEIVSEVYTVELVPALAEEAARRLRTLCYRNVHTRQGDGARGWPEAAPFAGIVVTCGAPEVPPDLLRQLEPGRRLVIPVGAPGDVMDLLVLEKDAEGGFRRRILMPVRFVPFVSPPSAPRQ